MLKIELSEEFLLLQEQGINSLLERLVLEHIAMRCFPAGAAVPLSYFPILFRRCSMLRGRIAVAPPHLKNLFTFRNDTLFLSNRPHLLHGYIRQKIFRPHIQLLLPLKPTEEQLTRTLGFEAYAGKVFRDILDTPADGTMHGWATPPEPPPLNALTPRPVSDTLERNIRGILRQIILGHIRPGDDVTARLFSDVPLVTPLLLFGRELFVCQNGGYRIAERNFEREFTRAVFYDMDLVSPRCQSVYFHKLTKKLIV